MEVLEAGEDLTNKLADERFLKGAVVGEEGGYGTSGDILEENVEVSAIRGGVEVLDDVCERSSFSQRAMRECAERLTVVLELLQKLNLTLQSVEHALLALLVVRVASGKLNLLDGHEGSAGGIHAEEDGSERTSADESPLDPLERRFACEEKSE